MKIGDRIYVRGHIDEIRKDTVIVRNDGGYFGTIPSEVITGELPPAQPTASDCWGCNCPKMERLAQPEPPQVAKDIARIVDNGQDMRVIGHGRIRGRWIIRETSSGDTEARCSHCGFTTLVDEPGNGLHMVSDLNFCPNCGAKMGVTT